MPGKKVLTEVVGIDELPDGLRRSLMVSPEHFILKDGSVYILQENKAIIVQDSEEGYELLHLLTGRKPAAAGVPSGREELFRRMLEDPEYFPEKQVLQQCNVNPYAGRRAVLFRLIHPAEKDFLSLFRSIAPLEDKDVVIRSGWSDILLIRETEGMTEEETAEYAEALIGTMESEGTDGIRAGIGQNAEDLYGLQESCRQAADALATGLRFHRNESVYIYSRLKLERILECISPEKRKEIGEILFPPGAPPLSDEILETVRIFFQNDLNLTAASRQLFIHRNTLNYRLDKIKKDYGLDLRRFTDAAVFKIITELSDIS